MIRKTLCAAALFAAAPLAPLPAFAQSQTELDAHYDRALAAGYKALFLCSAIANAELNGATRTPESVMEWELTGIQAPLNEIVGELEHQLYRDEDSALYAVTVHWGDETAPRIALHETGAGCSIQPIGYNPAFLAMEEVRDGDRNLSLVNAGGTGMEQLDRPGIRLDDLSSSYNQHINVAGAAISNEYGADARTTALIIVERGSIVGELYRSDFEMLVPQRTWSVAKSIAATLVGAAVYRGEADVSKSAGLGEVERDPRSEITIDQALRMASGRYSDTSGNRTDPLYFGGATVDEVAVDWPLINEPGSTYRYANNDTLAAVQSIEHTFADHPPASLFEALGMTHTVAETDWQGNYILSSQVWSTARDLARLGQLYLNDGVLPDGTRILPEGWVEYVSTPSGPQPGGALGYGAGWWLFNSSEGVPSDTIAAQGNRGQYIVVVPSRDVVIVRRGEDPAGGSGFEIVAFTRDVLAALAAEEE